MIQCKCGCGEKLDFTRGRKNKIYLPGHQFKHREFSPKHKENLSLSKLGYKNPMFGKGPNSGSFKKGEHNSPETEFKSLGKASLVLSIRSLNKMTEWKAQVRGRDNWTCRECGIRGIWVEAHHIKLFSKIIKENNIITIEQALPCAELWNLNNGITLCKECHKKKPKK